MQRLSVNIRRFTTGLIILGLAATLVGGCGTKDPEEIPVVLNVDSNNNPFDNPALADVVFVLNQPSDPTTSIVFPSACAASGSTNLPAGCGFSPSAAEFRLNLELVAQDVTITVTVRGRDVDGATLFEGTSASFANNPTIGQIEINVSATS